VTIGLSGQRSLVTGASGFIGSALVRRLLQHGSDVYAVSRNPHAGRADGIHWCQGDLEELTTARRVFEEAKPALVFHLASHVAGARDLALVMPTFASNLASTVNVLTSAAERGCDRIVLTGSLEEPSDPQAAPSSPYAAAKHAASGYARMFHALFGTPIVMLRLFMVYGPGQGDLRKLVPSVILSLLRGEPPPVSSGSREIDWIFLDDVVDARIAAAVAPQAVGTTLDVGSGRLVSIRSVVERLVQLVRPGIEPRFGAVPDRPLEQVRVADCARTKALIGWQPTTELDEGLRRTAEWYRERSSR
jgi:nucleoside-diphosphate-sugar epimerase